MDNDITKLLHIKDDNIHVISISDKDNTRTVTIERRATLHYCPKCGCRMHSKGISKRHVNHSIMQDGMKLILLIHQRRWQCKNPDCRNIETDQFSFVDPRRRNTNLTDMLIVNAFKDPYLSASDIARKFNVSPTQAITTFSRYVDMPRRQLEEIICIDEVYLGISKKCNYALVIQDFVTGEPIDMVVNRRQEVTDPYFNRISAKECNRVKYLVSDMYRPYQEYVNKYFPNAVPVVDSFHVIKLINSKFQAYIRKVIRKYAEQDQKFHEQKQEKFHRELPFKHSQDYLILKKYYWMLLQNQCNMKIYPQPKMNYRLGRMMNTYDYMDWLLRLDKNFEPMLKLKEKYVDFNMKYAGDPDGARKALNQIIDIYSCSEYQMFREIAKTLEEFFNPIITSFILVKRTCKSGIFDSRLSNGPIESLNRITKDMKREARGYANFEHIRNRFLFSQRKNAAILGKPKSLEQVYKEMPTRKRDEVDPYLIPEDEWEDNE